MLLYRQFSDVQFEDQRQYVTDGFNESKDKVNYFCLFLVKLSS